MAAGSGGGGVGDGNGATCTAGGPAGRHSIQWRKLAGGWDGTGSDGQLSNSDEFLKTKRQLNVKLKKKS